MLGWLTAAGGLIWFTVDSSGDTDRGWVPMLIVGLALLVSAAPIRRATWAVYGVFGVYAAVVHYLTQGLDEDRWPSRCCCSCWVCRSSRFGMVTHRYGKAWARRFVRRPPPTLSA